MKSMICTIALFVRLKENSHALFIVNCLAMEQIEFPFSTMIFAFLFFLCNNLCISSLVSWLFSMFGLLPQPASWSTQYIHKRRKMPTDACLEKTKHNFAFGLFLFRLLVFVVVVVVKIVVVVLFPRLVVVVLIYLIVTIISCAQQQGEISVSSLRYMFVHRQTY